MAASGPGSFPERGNLKGSSEPEPLIHLFKFAGMLVVWPSQCDPSGMLVVWLSQWALCFYLEKPRMVCFYRKLVVVDYRKPSPPLFTPPLLPLSIER